MKTAIYPLSADPIHNGHIDNIKRILKMDRFDTLYVAIGKNYVKKPQYLFTDQEKLQITKQALKKFPATKIKVEVFDGLLAHYAKKKNTNIIIRGLRNSADFENEQLMAEFNRSYHLETLMLPAKKDTFNISSTTIKSIVSNSGLVNEFVPLVIKQALEEKLLKINLIGVTGNIGSGKTTICKKLSALKKDINFIEVDRLIKNLYKSSEEVRENVKNIFGANIYKGKNINRKKLALTIFNDSGMRRELVEILRTPFKIALEEEIKNLKGLVLLDCAYLAEYDLLPFVNNNVIFLTCKDQAKIARNKNAESVLKIQFPDKALKFEIKQQQKKAAYGNLLQINTEKPINYRQVLAHLDKWHILN